MAKKKAAPGKSSKLKAEHFMVWVTLPAASRTALRTAAGSVDLPMSEFARRAVLEAVRRVEAGEAPFPASKDS